MHTMTLVNEHDGIGEWLCPTCGRHLLVSWDPVYKKTVLVEGNPTFDHIRIKRMLQTENKRDTQTAMRSRSARVSKPDPRLLPWIKWMEERGFDDLWEGETR